MIDRRKTDRDYVDHGEEPDLDAEYQRCRRTLAINRDDLDTEVAQHAEKFFRVAEMAVLASAAYDQIKQDLKLVEARVAKEVRAAAAAEERKISNDAVEMEVLNDREIKTLHRELGDAKLAMDKWSALKEAFGQRSKMVTESVGLYISKYYSRNSVSAQTALQDHAVERVREARHRRG